MLLVVDLFAIRMQLKKGYCLFDCNPFLWEQQDLSRGFATVTLCVKFKNDRK